VFADRAEFESHGVIVTRCRCIANGEVPDIRAINDVLVAEGEWPCGRALIGLGLETYTYPLATSGSSGASLIDPRAGSVLARIGWG